MSWKMEYMVFRILYRLKMKELAMRLNCSLALIIVCLTVFPSLVWGNMTGDELERFQPLDGYVVQSTPREIIIDCGLQKGVRIGDLFTVLVSGPPLVHPTTGQVIGTRDQKVSVLKVVKVDAAYAVALPLGRYLRVPVLRGQRVRRFTNQRLLFIDADGQEMETYSKLKAVLPQLIWEEYAAGLGYRTRINPITNLSSLGYDLYMVADRQRITVFNGDLNLLGTIPVVALRRSGAAKAPAGVAGYSLSTAEREKVRISSYRKAGEINLVVKSLDMGDVTGDRLPEVVFTNGEKIYVYTLTAKGLKYRYRYAFAKWGTIANIQVADVDGDRKKEIIVNSFKETEDGFSSFIIGYQNKKFKLLAQGIPYIMGVIGGESTSQKGAYFLGQTFAVDEIFGHQVYRLRLRNGKVSSGDAFAVPQGFRLVGAVYDDVNGNGRRELCFINKQSYLEIYSGSKRLWVSDQRLGGSLHDLQIEVGTARMSTTEKIPINPSLRVIDTDGDGAKELLVVKNTSSISTAVGEYGFLSRGSINMVKKSGTGFSVLTLTGTVDGPIQSLNVLGKELFVTMVKRGEDLLKTTGDSYLLSFPLPGR